MKKIKVLHLPTSVGGNSYGLSRAERSLGVQSDILTQEFTYLNYPADIQLDLSKCRNKVSKRFKRLMMFLQIRNKYNVFHFNYGASLFGYPISLSKKNYLDLKFYPKKSKLFVTYNGCDARQRDLTLEKKQPFSFCKECDNESCKKDNLDERRKKSIEIMSQYVSHIWALNPDLLTFLPNEKASFLPYSICNYNEIVYLPKFEKKLTIIHAPTNRSIKGSKYIIETLEKLKKEYPTLFSYRIIENMKHSQALEIFQTADLVIDQTLGGWYGAFAVELMLMGKPVIARISENDLCYIPKKMKNDLLATIIDVNPLTIYKVLENCINNKSFLKQRSEASLEYARKWHSPKYVASITKNAYEKALT